jgi:hypothetical protein
MNLYRLCSVWLLLGLVAWTVCDKVSAQTWQEPATENANPQVEWQQRVIKRPPNQNQKLQWHAAGQSNNSDTVQQTSWQEETSAPYQQPPVSRQPAASPFRTSQRPVHNKAVFASSTMPRGRQRATLTAGEEVIPPGPVTQPQPQPQMEPQTEFEPVATEGEFADVGGCDTSCGAPCGETCDFGWEVFDGTCGPWLRGLSVFVGADGFKGPIDRGQNGNFGLNEGLNIARPLGDPWGCGYQIGANFVQSDFSGAPNVEVGDYNLRSAFRKQYFATAGIFRRADKCGGFQGGIAYDYLYDMHYENSSVQQLRSETGYVLNDVYEIGYYGAYGIGTDRTIDGRLDATDMFVLFLRKNFENGGDGRIWGGATGNGDGLLGVNLWIPLGKSFALENRINYMIPKQGRGTEAATRESWGLVAQLVWYPGQNAKCQQQNPYRPLFNVADNSLFMVDRMVH